MKNYKNSNRIWKCQHWVVMAFLGGLFSLLSSASGIPVDAVDLDNIQKAMHMRSEQNIVNIANAQLPSSYTAEDDNPSFSLVWLSDEIGTTNSVAWGDYDNDGDLDLALSGTPRLYRNDNGTLTHNAIWSAIESDRCYSVAWGDYDNDGDLDLIAGTGNVGVFNHLYRNDDGVLTTTAVWSPVEADDTRSVAWGDFDGDGDLDLATGNSPKPNRLYRNDDGILTPSAVWSSTESDLTNSIAWGDYDSDGDLDLVTGNEYQPNRLYRNDNGILSHNAVWSSSETDGTRSVVWGDYDNDGDLDLAVGNGNGVQSNRLYRNDSGVLTTNAVWSSVERDDTRSVAWGDYDSDGDLDLMVGNSGSDRLYRNNGGILTSSAVWSSHETNTTESIGWGDYDNDGDLDFIAGGGGRTRLYRNDISVLSSSRTWATPEQEWTRSIAWADYDGDGDLDLAVGNGIYLGEQSNRVYRNEEGVLSLFPAWSSNEVDDTRSLAWGDYDNDGDPDLVVGNWGQPNRIYRNDGGVLTAKAVWSSNESAPTLSVAWGDYDADGDPDLAVGNGGAGNSIFNQLYRNDDGVLTSDAIWSSLESDDTQSVAWGDYDGDNDLDLAVGNGTDSTGQPNRLYRNDGGILSSSAVWSSEESSITYSIAWGDYDNDGDLDLAVGNYRKQTNQLYRNDQGVLTSSAIWLSDEADDTCSIAWGDYDSDGDLDLIIGNMGNNRLYRNDAGILTSSAIWSSYEGDWTNSVAWGDYDNDGDLDFAAGNYFASPSRLYRNDEGLLTPKAVWSSLGGENPRDVAWGDYDNDGDLDLAMANYGSQNRLFRNDNGMLSAVAWSSDESDDSTSIVWGDYDADGDIDIIVGNSNQPIRLYRNDTGYIAPIATKSFGESAWTHSLAWGDYDNDGDLDLAVGNSGRPNRIYRNDNGVLTTSFVWSTDESDATWDIAWGDYDGDGDLDLVTGNWRDPNRLYRNDDGQLLTSAVWSSNEANSTYSVAWGDYDSDGDLDLAVGDTGGFTNLYCNDNGELTTSAVWSSDEVSGGSNLAWGDYDGDGDLDLGSGGSIYRNDKGKLVINAAWTASDPGSGTGMAWGDYDNDGDLDLSLGTRLYDNNRDVHQGISPIPVVWTSRPYPPSNSNFYSSAQVWPEPTVPIPYKLFHIGNLSVQQISGLYSLNSGGQWLPAVVASNTITSDLDTASYTGHRYLTTATGPIPDFSTLTSTLTLTETDPIADIDISLNLAHTSDSDLVITLTAPFTRSALLVNRRGGSGDNFTNTVFDDDAPTSIISGTAPFTGRYRPEQVFDRFVGYPANGEWALSISDQVTGNVGTLLSWGITVTLNTGAVHTYTWDVYESGFMGQSDNVVFRMVAIPAIENRPNQIPGPYLYGSYASHTFPFRVRGSQVRVLSDTVPAQNALVYRLPVSQTVGAAPYVSLSGEPFRTDGQGYLQGRGEIWRGDRLFAMLPITSTDSYTLYYTSGDPTLSGIDFYTVTALGVQTLTVSSANPLLLFNLDVSLEWDARSDAAYVSQLERDLERASQILYDLSNGQMALGRVRVYQAKEHWMDAHVVVYASNSVRPNANLGGIVSEGMDEISVSGVITDAYVPGQVRIGATWNRFGDTIGNLGEDWPRVLAHELSHYLLFLEDNYLGLSPEGFLINTDCRGSAMTDPYSDAYSEYLTADAWTGECLDTLAEYTVGRADWETIDTFYPMVNADRTNTGPNTLPLAVTQIAFAEIITPSNTLAAPFFSLIDAAGRPLDAGQASGYLFKTQGTAEPTDDYAIALGAPNRDLLQARGAAPGDRLCVFDESHTPVRLGCLAPVGNYEAALALHEVPGWQPQVRITPVTSRTFMITVTQVTEAALSVQFLPDDGPASGYVAMNPIGSDFVQTLTLDEPAFSGFARVWVPGSNPHRETVTEFFLGDGWAARARAWSARARAWSARARAWSAPIVSGDGQVTVFDLDNILGGGQANYTLQTLTSLPTLPAWLTPVGHAYRFSAGDVPARGSILFWYLQRDVPEGQEYDLHIYYSPDEGQTWERLDTNLDDYRNMASANVQGEGMYVLISTIALPPFSEGWNNFGYPVPGTRPITDALASIAGKYTSVYNYDSALPLWRLYDRPVVANHPGFAALVNDLPALEFGRAYWLYATEPVTLYLAPQTDYAVNQATAFQMPPATYYGFVYPAPIHHFTPTAGLTVTAKVGDVVCGQTTLQPVQPFTVLPYRIQAVSENLGGPSNGCGLEGYPLTLEVDGQVMSTTVIWKSGEDLIPVTRPITWSDIQAHWVNLSVGPLTQVDEPLAGLWAINNGPTLIGYPTTLSASVLDGNSPSYTWTFGDGEIDSGATVQHTYAIPGTYTATVTAHNAVSTLAAMTVVHVLGQTGFEIYLPVVLRYY